MIKKMILTSLLTFTSIHADTLNPLLQIGYDWGGDTLATVYHDYEGTNTIRAGNGLNLEAGAVYQSPQSNLELRFLVGYKIDSDSAYNGDVTWDVIPFTALAMFKAQNWKFGGGATYHLDPKLSGSFSGYDNGVYFNDSVNDVYDNAFGGVAQIQYQPTEAFGIGLKATFIEYQLKNNPTVKVNGDSLGIVFTYAFGNEYSEFR